MTDLEKLAELCERATGPDRELDCRIRCVAERLDFEQCLKLVPNLIDWIARPYTASLDAAMTLVPEGWRPIIDTASEEGAALVDIWCPLTTPKPRRSHAKAATPAIALCAAALRARAASADRSPQGQDGNRLDAQHESAVPKADAQKEPS